MEEFIETNEYNLSKEIYLQMLMKKTFINNKFTLVALPTLSVILIYKNMLYGYFMLVFTILYPFYIYYKLHKYVNSKDNKIFFTSKKIIFNENNIFIITNNDLQTEIPFDYCVKKVETIDYWLFYLSQSHFHYIPKNIFKSPSDLLQFKQLIKSKTKFIQTGKN